MFLLTDVTASHCTLATMLVAVVGGSQDLVAKLYSSPINDPTLGAWRSIDTYFIDISSKGKFLERLRCLSGILFDLPHTFHSVFLLSSALEEAHRYRQLKIHQIIVSCELYGFVVWIGGVWSSCSPQQRTRGGRG